MVKKKKHHLPSIAVIKKFNNAAYLAGLMGLHKETIYKWRLSGIPNKHYVKLKALAHQHEIDLTFNDFHEVRIK